MFQLAHYESIQRFFSSKNEIRVSFIHFHDLFQTQWLNLQFWLNLQHQNHVITLFSLFVAFLKC